MNVFIELRGLVNTTIVLNTSNFSTCVQHFIFSIYLPSYKHITFITSFTLISISVMVHTHECKVLQLESLLQLVLPMKT